MKNVYNVFKKEFDKIIKFPRAIFSSLILPGLIIFIVYFFIGTIMESEFANAEAEPSIIHTINAPVSFTDQIPETLDNDFIKSDKTKEELQKDLKDANIDAFIIFPEVFDEQVENNIAPEVKIYYRADKLNSEIAYGKITMVLELQKNIILDSKGINPVVINDELIDLAEEGASTAMYLSMIFPMVIISLIFGAAMGIGSEAIAGEKERGTLSKMLLLPIKRSEIVGGKVASTAILTILSGISSFIGVVASLPFMAGAMFPGGPMPYGFIEYLGLFGIVILVSIFASVLLLIISTFSKNVKEANAYSTPFFLAAMFLPMINMMNMGKQSQTSLYFIPYFNMTLGFTDLLAQNMDLANYAIIFGTNLVFIALLVVVLTKMFKSEKILFAK